MILLVDIDHTLSHADWRDHLRHDWDAYHAASINDEPIIEMIRMTQDLMAAGWRGFGFTARPQKWEYITKLWLQLQGVKFEEILMRADESWRPSVDIKCDLLMQRFANINDEPMIILDDHPLICEALSKKNLTCLQVYARMGEPNKLDRRYAATSAQADPFYKEATR